MKTKHLFLLPVLAFFACAGLQAQVTIGGETDPARGAILDLNSTAKGGLLLSNVTLTDLLTIPTEIPESAAINGDADKKTALKGAMVYHIGGGTANIPAGAYVWDGEKWTPIGGEKEEKNMVNTVTDAQGNDYTIAEFGAAGTWMTQNLRTTDVTYSSGIPVALTERADTDPETIPYYTYPGKDNDDDAREAALSDPELLKSYGLLYNWAAATGRTTASSGNEEWGNPSQTEYRGVCPAGWHLPSDWEWTQLELEIDANPDKYSDTTLGEGTGRRMKSDGRNQENYVNGINPQGSSFSRDKGGFDALLVGVVNNIGYAFDYGSFAYFWSSSSHIFDGADGVFRELYRNTTDVTRSIDARGLLYSVRCKKNSQL